MRNVDALDKMVFELAMMMALTPMNDKDHRALSQAQQSLHNVSKRMREKEKENV